MPIELPAAVIKVCARGARERATCLALRARSAAAAQGSSMRMNRRREHEACTAPRACRAVSLHSHTGLAQRRGGVRGLHAGKHGCSVCQARGVACGEGRNRLAYA